MQKHLKYIRILCLVFGMASTVLLTACGANPVPAQGVTLDGVHLQVASATLDKSFPAGCTGGVPACTPAQKGNKILSVAFEPSDLPEGQMLAYKNLPAVSVIMRTGEAFPYSLYKYENTTHILTLGFEVPESATAFELKWADLAEMPLNVAP